MNKQFVYILTIVALLYSCGKTANQQEQQTAVAESSTPQYISLHIEYDGQKPSKTINKIPWTTNMNIDSAMNRARHIAPFITFITKKSLGLGTFYTSMDSVSEIKGEQKYWLLCVNDSMSNVGTNDRILHPNDVIQWKLSKFEEVSCIKLNQDGNE